MTICSLVLCKYYDLKMPDYDYERMFEVNILPHQIY